MPYKNPQDNIKRQQERRANMTEEQREIERQKDREYSQRPEVKERRKQYSKQYHQIQTFKKRQKIGEEIWYRNQITGFNLGCLMDYQYNFYEDEKDDQETYMHSRNHELLYLIYKKNILYEEWLNKNHLSKTKSVAVPPPI